MYVATRFSPEEVAVIHHEVPSAQRHATFASLRQPGGRQWLVLHEARCLGLGTDLPHVSKVVVFDSELSPLADLASLSRPLRLGTAACDVGAAGLAVFRIVAAPVEERLLELQAAAGQAAEGILRPAPGKAMSVASELLEDVIRAGAARLLSPPDAGAGEPAVGQLPEEELAAVVAAATEPEATAGGDLVRRWALAMPEAAEAAVGAWDEHHMPLLEVVSPFEAAGDGAADAIERFDQTVHETATFWDSLLRER